MDLQLSRLAASKAALDSTLERPDGAPLVARGSPAVAD